MHRGKSNRHQSRVIYGRIQGCKVATGGYVCYPDKLGSAVFVVECTKDNPESCRRERHQILGIATKQLIEEWKSIYGDFNDEAKKYIMKD